MDYETFVRSSILEVLDSPNIHILLKQGMHGYLYELAQEGQTLTERNEKLKMHFESFPFIRFDGEVEVKNIPFYKFSILRDQFKESGELQECAERYALMMEKHAKKLQREADDARNKAQSIRNMFLKDQLLV